MSDLLKRSLSGGIYVALLIATLVSQNVAMFLSLFSVFIFVGVWEYEWMFKLNRTRPLRIILDGIAAVYLFIATYLIMCREFMPNDIAKVIFAQLYVGLFFAAAIPLFVLNPWILLFIFVCIWCNDTGAYIFGCNFGKYKLFPSVSPKKSWEGFVGGFVTVLIIATLFALFVDALDFEWYRAMSLAAIISIFATWGDLFESMLKRSAGVKDSGKIIPGHGGVLDRLDSFLFVAPAIYLTTLF